MPEYRILGRELSGMTGWLAGQDDPGRAAATMRRFGDLIRATPSLRAYQSDMMDQFVTVATQILAERAALSPGDPEPQITARALLGLWHVQAESLRKHLDARPDRLHELVTSDVRRAARLIDTGLRSFGSADAQPRPAPARRTAAAACRAATRIGSQTGANGGA
jgi:MftR C-terminal domain